MKRGIKILIMLNVIMFLILAGLFFLAETYPFSPGDPLFALQSTAESSRVKLAKNPEKRVEMSFELVERRLADLAMVSDPDKVKPAVEAFDQVLTQAIISIQAVSEEEAANYYQEVQTLLLRVDLVLGSVEKNIEHEHLAALHEKVAILQSATTPLEIQKLALEQTLPSIIAPKAVPFLSQDVDHIDFTLTDAHENLECEQCHANGVYVDTATECSSCHIREEVIALLSEAEDCEIKRSERVYPYHFKGECSDCHEPITWDPKEFDHRGIYDCISCHYDDYPQDEEVIAMGSVNFIGLATDKIKTTIEPHYPGDCISCHTDTEDWAEYNYDHQLDTCESCHGSRGFIEEMNRKVHECTREQTCESCHQYEKHPSYYEGIACITCHQDVKEWLPANLDHQKLPNCVTCHEKDKPEEDHYKSNCSTCHFTGNWKTLALDHTTKADCKSCHTQPVNHRAGEFVGQCVSCHTLKRWKPTTFNHTLSNCSTCHVSPVSHYPAQCSACHVSNSWLKISVNHAGMNVCTDCHNKPTNHYAGLCTDCHISSTWYTETYHNSYSTVCGNCHMAPIAHFPGTCESCHTNTDNWSSSFNHSSTSYTCSTCHPKPYGHWSGECSNCHFTDSWSNISFDHTGFTLCNSCHLRPVGHPRGQCFQCHNTYTWEVPPTPTPLPTNTPLPTFTPTNTPLPTFIPTFTPEPTLEPTATPDPTETPEPTSEPDSIDTVEP
ncbi:MAG: hypothetical protein CVU41_08255 [Chloroflexi bacterium HGW-Chloroflexi-3]|nr:MAG: hypothetical protein CVU41_08255 [Chloroflexi bacterium HGW-Chloroflexi-3]